MQKRLFLLCFLCIAGIFSMPSESYAQNQPLAQDNGWVLQRFRPSFDPNGLYNAYGGETMQQWGFYAGAWFNFSYRPLTIVGKGKPQDLVFFQLGADVGGGISFLDRKWAGLELTLSLPILIFGSGRTLNDINCGLPGEVQCQETRLPVAGVGDLGVALKYRLLDQRWQGVNLAFVVGLTFPTGSQEPYYGANGVGFEGSVVVSRRFFEIWNVVGNLGVRYRPPRSFFGLNIRSEFIYRIGTSVEVLRNKMEILLELSGGVGLGNVNINNVPLELLLGLRFYPLGQKTLVIDVGGGPGLTAGYGIPNFRFFVGISYAHRRGGPVDTDEDGIVDVEDKCPNQPGPKSNDGCPLDTDKDGIIDTRDRCPKVPGPRENRGCPWGDQDKDGVTDNEDQCPDKPGAPDNNGCPWGDTDGDGLKDNVDQCPKVAGPKVNHGCPDKDRDNDTVVDRKDNCPNIPGPVANKGCPKKVLIKVNRKTGRILLLEKVYFDTAKATIKKRSFPILTQVVAVMRSNPKIRIRIEGHTDSRGSARMNLGLSRRRAAAVRRHLIKKGNIDAGRLESRGYGEAKPITTNKTRAGRAKNRRVEFHIVK